MTTAMDTTCQPVHRFANRRRAGRIHRPHETARSRWSDDPRTPQGPAPTGGPRRSCGGTATWPPTIAHWLKPCGRRRAPGAFERLVRTTEAAGLAAACPVRHRRHPRAVLGGDLSGRCTRHSAPVPAARASRTRIGCVAPPPSAAPPETASGLDRSGGASPTRGDDDAEAWLVMRPPIRLDLEAQVADAQLQRHLQAAVEVLPPLPRLLPTLYHLEELRDPRDRADHRRGRRRPHQSLSSVSALRLRLQATLAQGRRAGPPPAPPCTSS